MSVNFGKELWKVKVEKEKKRTYEFLEALSLNPSHRWIPFTMISKLNHILATERQIQWIRSICKSRIKVNVTFERVTLNPQQ